jgi:signal peptidase I
MFCGYVAALLAGLLFAGTWLGLLLLGLAASLHAASITDIMAAQVSDLRRRLIYSGVVLFLLVFAAYYPAGQLLGWVATPIQFNLPSPPFEAGDVVLVNHSAYWSSDPQPGDVVQYVRGEQDIPMAGRHGTYRLGGDHIDRILARGGDKVTYVQGQLRVNGELSPWLSLDPLPLPDSLETVVPEGCYFILPSARVPQPDMWRFVNFIPRRQISGRVYWRTQPLWRFGIVR